MPKVFISYSHDDDKHKRWVYDLATKLRINGVDVIFDIFETRLGSDLPLFMEQGLSESNRVICICSEIYNKKSNSGTSGAGYEKRIICSELINSSSTAWVIPLIRNNNTQDKLPIFLSSLKYISFENDGLFLESYYVLLRELHNQRNLPPLGKNPFEHNADIIGTIEEKNQIISALSFTNKEKGEERFNYLANSGIFTIGLGIYQFATNWSTASTDSIHAYKDSVKSIACTSENIDVNNFDLNKYDFSSRSRTARIGDTIIWVNREGKVLITKINKIEVENNQIHWLSITYRIIENLTFNPMPTS